jgi:hypothetical protein
MIFKQKSPARSGANLKVRITMRHIVNSRLEYKPRIFSCGSCGKQIEHRAGRRPRFCSSRCRKREHYAQNVRRGVFSGIPTADTALATKRSKRDSEIKALQRAKTLSSHRIYGFADVLAMEVWGGREWQPATSSGSVPIEVGRLRARVLAS